MTRNELDAEDISLIVAENLIKLREFQGLSQKEMAEKIRTSQAGYSLSEKGTRDLNLLNLYYIAVEFGIDLNSFFGLSDDKLNATARVKHLENLTMKTRRRINLKPKKAVYIKKGYPKRP